ncbi:LysR family transcriptional regulator [Vibrio marisflavi]|uniref:Glycine cleavage system transcriptional activator n=1 Tax=Vibrio marisflavi CECT 7928 TaxID=634439 RepID=A0ABM8ZZ53_9VIBR|nr:LysR family transcriptional regulator [Vibrio marisflavi]CAH0536309.1 Glycine cleavage system transcriptional activator [Vibrio marisflavi CECT 7928]
MNKITPLKSLYSFVAVAETGSMSEAADMLNVSHSAISQSIKSLESYLGVELFQRVNRTVVLNAQGKQYYKQISPALEQISHATQSIIDRRYSHRLTLNMVHSLAMHWWIPRVERFNQFSNTLDIRISNLVGNFSLQQEGIDVALVLGKSSEWENYHCEFLGNDELVMVANPNIIPPEATSSELLQQFPAIIATNERRANDWQIWCEAKGLPMPKFGHNLSFNATIQALQAAISQLGLFITHKIFIRDYVEQGMLVEIGDSIPNPKQDFYFICQPEQLSNEFVLLLRSWIKAEFSK